MVKKSGWLIGHYGCNNRLVKLRAPVKSNVMGHRPMKGQIVPCPACERVHPVDVLWRNPRDHGEVDLAELEVLPKEKRQYKSIKQQEEEARAEARNN